MTGVHLPDRIEADAHALFGELQMRDGPIIVIADTDEYAAAVGRILEGLYPGALDRITFEIAGRPPDTTG